MQIETENNDEELNELSYEEVNKEITGESTDDVDSNIVNTIIDEIIEGIVDEETEPPCAHVYPYSTNSMWSCFISKSYNFEAINASLGNNDYGCTFTKRPIQLFHTIYRNTKDYHDISLDRPINKTDFYSRNTIIGSVMNTEMSQEKTEINIPESYKMIVVFKNAYDTSKTVAVLKKNDDINDLEILKDLYVIGLEHIIIESITFTPFDNENLVESLVKHYNLSSLYNNDKDRICLIYKILKILTPGRYCKNILMKSVMEYMYCNYEINFNESVEFESIYTKFSEANTITKTALNILLDEERFLEHILFLGFHVTYGKVQYITPRKHAKPQFLQTELELNALLQTSYVSKISHQLRKEPFCVTRADTCTWLLMSSHKEYIQPDNTVYNSRTQLL